MTRIADAWLRAPGPQAICAVLTGAGHQALFVGGCVRNALLRRAVADIDIATDARPDRVIALAEAAGLRAAPTGIAHGTVTFARAGERFEVTTFRRDVTTDGRRAAVAFSDDLAEDAARRDFTMNALYARPDGTVLDPLGGLADLRAGRVRFVGDPAARIAEDYLRVLRFFRFHAWYGDPAAGLDSAGLKACAAAGDGLESLSRERVGAEFARLLDAPDPAPAVAAMAAADLLARILPEAEAGGLGPLVRLERAGGHPPRWLRRLAALGWRPSWPARLRLARAERRQVEAIAAALASEDPPAAAAYRHGAETARDAALIRASRLGVLPPQALAAEIARGAAAAFPLRAADLPHHGPALGAALGRLEAAWIGSDFTLEAPALLALDAARAP